MVITRFIPLVAAGTVLIAGCQTSCPVATSNAPAAVSAADSDRAALAKLVGAWDFEGSWKSPDKADHKVQGRAAGTLENDYFVLMDIQTTSGDLAGRPARKAGSFLFASEPGVGMTVTAWGDASPSITRLVGHSSNDGNTFTFAPAHATDRNVHLIVRMQSDSQWTAAVVDADSNSEVATYTFTRSAK